jgi:hypothetical protein
LGFAAFAASFVSYRTFLRGTIGSSSDEQVLRGLDTLTQGFGGIQLRLRVSSLVFLAAALCAAAGRRKVGIWIEESVFPLPQFLRDVAIAVARGLKADGGLNVAVLAAFFLIGLVERLRLLFRPFNFDEADTFIKFAARPLYIGISWYPEPNNHVFHTVLMHFALRLFGDHEWALRIPALIAGCLITPLTYWAARALYNKNAALISAAMVTTASYLIFYSIDARGYSMQCVFFLLLVIISQYLLEHESAPAWLLWVLFATLGLYTLPTTIYAVASLGLWLALSYWLSGSAVDFRRRLGRLGVTLGLTAALSALLYAPLLIGTGPSAASSNKYLAPRVISQVISETPSIIIKTWRMWVAEVPVALVWIFVAGFVVSVLLHRRIAKHGLPILAMFLICVPPLVLAQRVMPLPRVWIFLLPLFAAISAAGLSAILSAASADEPRGAHLSLVAALSILIFMSTPDIRGTRLAKNGQHAEDGIQDTVAWIGDHLKPGDLILVGNGVRAPFDYYLRRRHIALISRPAQCDARAVTVYGSKAALAGRSVVNDRLLMVSGRGGWEVSFVACQSPDSGDPKAVGESGGMKIYEVSPLGGSQLTMLGVPRVKTTD